MSQMAVVVNRDPAAVNAYFVRSQRNERLNAARQCVREPQRHNQLVAIKRLRVSRRLCDSR